MDTKQLIEQVKKELKQQYDEEIARLKEVYPAPAPAANITPQEAFDGTWDAIKALAENEIAFYAGQIIEFNVAKTGTKFEDTTLFTKYNINANATLVGINQHEGSMTNGEVISHTHQSPYYDTFRYQNRGAGDPHQNDNSVSLTQKDPNSNWMYAGASSGTDQNHRFFFSGSKQNVSSTGGAVNAAYGLEILKVVYVAKKDITKKEFKS